MCHDRTCDKKLEDISLLRMCSIHTLCNNEIYQTGNKEGETPMVGLKYVSLVAPTKCVCGVSLEQKIRWKPPHIRPDSVWIIAVFHTMTQYGSLFR